MTVLFVTGHRPDKITRPDRVRQTLIQIFSSADIDAVWIGMAPGADTIAGLAALDLGVPIRLAIPWAGHRAVNGQEKDYLRLLTKAEQVVFVNESEKFPGKWVYQKRNEYMVDHADRGVSVWDGSPQGGTFNTLSYALRKNVPVLNINPDTLEAKKYGSEVI